MKATNRVLVALLALGIGASSAAAQSPFRVGIIGGANISGAWGEDAEGYDTRTGFDVGGLIQIPMGMVITLQPEVHYTQKGFTSPDLGTGETQTSLDYLQVPVLFKAGVPLAEGFDVDFQFGPSFGFLLSCQEDGDEDCSDRYEGFDWGIIAGGSFAWAAGAGDVLLDIRYDLGLAEVRAGDDPADVKNTNFQFLIGYAFPL